MKVQLIGKKLNNNGFATLEIVIAFAITILSISSVIFVAFGNQSIAVDLQLSNESIGKAKKGLEDARANSRFDFNLVNPWTTTENSGGVTYTKKIEVTQTDLFTKKVVSIVTWQIASKIFSTMLTTLLTNPEAATGGGDTCSSVLSGDWVNPQLTYYEFGKDLLVPSDTSNDFPIGGIDVSNHILYAVINNSSSNNNPTFFKFDVTNPLVKPIFISSTDNNPFVKSGFSAVHVAGNYAYLANAYGANYSTCAQSLSCSQLQVMDLNTMFIVGKLKVPGATGSSGQAIGKSVFYKDGIVYLGLAKTLSSGPEFSLIDVGGAGLGGSPTNPVYISGLNVGNGVNALVVRDGYAYVASPNNEELKVIDVSTPSSPFQVGQYDAPGGGGNNGNGETISIVGNTIYLGRTLLTGNELYILNKFIPATNLSVLGSRDIKNSSNKSTSVNGIVIRDYLVFLLANDDFQILKQDSSYTLSQYASPLNTPGGKGTTMDCEGNYIFVGSKSSDDKGYISIISAN